MTLPANGPTHPEPPAYAGPERSGGVLVSLTPKGRQTTARILDAATVVLGRHGFAGASLRMIALEAGVDKRNVLYYYGTREALLVRVVQSVGERIAKAIEDRVAESAESPPGARTIVDALWAGVTSQPELAHAYIALLGRGTGAPEIDEALLALKGRYWQLIEGMLRTSETEQDHAVTSLCLAVMRGLLLEWTETGATPALRASLDLVTTIIDERLTELD